jgi:hypothetical protein
VFQEIVKWAAILVLLIGGAIAIHTLYPFLRGHIALGAAASLLLLGIYAVQRLQD